MQQQYFGLGIAQVLLTWESKDRDQIKPQEK